MSMEDQEPTQQARLVSIRTMADLLGVSIQGLRKWEKQGVITPYRLPGGERRYDVELTKHQLLTKP